MLFGNREPRSLVARRRGAYRPAVRVLETRVLMAVAPVDLGGGVTSGLPITTLDGIGDLVKPVRRGRGRHRLQRGRGSFSTADVGDLTGSGFDDYVISLPRPTSIRNGVQVNRDRRSSSAAGVYLILGSATTNAGTISKWLDIPTTPTTPSADSQTGDQRVGDLGQLGNSTLRRTRSPGARATRSPGSSSRPSRSRRRPARRVSVADAGDHQRPTRLPDRGPGWRRHQQPEPGDRPRLPDLRRPRERQCRVWGQWQQDPDRPRQPDPELGPELHHVRQQQREREDRAVGRRDRRHLRGRDQQHRHRRPRGDGQRQRRRGRRLRRPLQPARPRRRHDLAEHDRPGRGPGFQVTDAAGDNAAILGRRPRRFQRQYHHLEHRHQDHRLRDRRPERQRRHGGRT